MHIRSQLTMSNENGALSKTVLKNHEMQDFEMFSFNLERYFKDFQQHVNINQVMIPDYPLTSLQCLPIDINSYCKGPSAVFNENSVTTSINEIKEEKQRQICSSISLLECIGASEISPSCSSQDNNVPYGEATILSNSHLKRCTEPEQQQINEPQMSLHRESAYDVKTPDIGKGSLQSLLQLSFAHHNEALHEGTTEKWMKQYEKLVDDSCQILSAPLNYDAWKFKQKLHECIDKDLEFEGQIPLPVIEATFANINRLVKKSIERSTIRQNIRHFVYMHTSNHPPDSKEYWRQCKQDLNLEPPDELDAVEATESQRCEYHQLVSNIKRKRERLHALQDDRLEEYRNKME